MLWIDLRIDTILHESDQDGHFLLVQSSIKQRCYFVHNIQCCVGLRNRCLVH